MKRGFSQDLHVVQTEVSKWNPKALELVEAFVKLGMEKYPRLFSVKFEHDLTHGLYFTVYNIYPDRPNGLPLKQSAGVRIPTTFGDGTSEASAYMTNIYTEGQDRENRIDKKGPKLTAEELLEGMDASSVVGWDKIASSYHS